MYTLSILANLVSYVPLIIKLKKENRKYKLEFTAEYNLKKLFRLANEEPTRSVPPPASGPSPSH